MTARSLKHRQQFRGELCKLLVALPEHSEMHLWNYTSSHALTVAKRAGIIIHTRKLETGGWNVKRIS